MKIFTNDSYYFASCQPGLESLLQQELTELGAKDLKTAIGGVEFQAPIESVLKMILHSRFASKLLKKLVSIQIGKEKDLYPSLVKFNWDEVFNVWQTFKVKTIIGRDKSSDKSRFKNSHYISQTIKDSIVDFFRNKTNQRPNVEITYPDVIINAYIGPMTQNQKSKVDIWFDLCGESLGNRHFRQERFSAPLKENLAAGLLTLAKWNPEKEILIDPMCGQGTILFEAACLKGRIPPSYLKVRKYIEEKDSSKTNKTFWAIQKLPIMANSQNLQKIWEQLIQQVWESYNDGMDRLKAQPITIFGGDIEKRTIDLASRNLEHCELLKFIKLKKQNATTMENTFGPKGVVICNPPYGERLGNTKELEGLYHEFGENLKQNFKGYRAYILTSEPQLRKVISLRTTRRIPLYNGGIECRLLEYELF